MWKADGVVAHTERPLRPLRPDVGTHFAGELTLRVVHACAGFPEVRLRHPLLDGLAVLALCGTGLLGVLAWCMYGIARVIDNEERD